MSLRKYLFWKKPEQRDLPATPGASLAQIDDKPPPAESGAPQSNVVALPMARPDTEHSLAQEGPAAGPRLWVPRFEGLMNAPELTAFFSENYFGFGRYTGSNYRSRDALDSGLQEMIAKFQNVLTDLVERRQTKHDRLKREVLKVEGLAGSIAAELNLACEHLEREMTTLRQQSDLAEQRKGWILEAINRYQSGFDRGVREALEVELLGGWKTK